jgi:hypothetical protein
MIITFILWKNLKLVCFFCSMASLLAKFRIDYSDLKVIPDITKKPRDSTVSFFESLISEFKQTEASTDGGSSDDPSKKC